MSSPKWGLNNTQGAIIGPLSRSAYPAGVASPSGNPSLLRGGLIPRQHIGEVVRDFEAGSQFGRRMDQKRQLRHIGGQAQVPDVLLRDWANQELGSREPMAHRSILQIVYGLQEDLNEELGLRNQLLVALRVAGLKGAFPQR